MKKILKIMGIIIGVLLGIVLIYVAYVFLSYRRIEDYQTVPIEESKENRDREEQNLTHGKDILSVGEEYKILTYNIGFGAYTPEFSFFMDGGKSSVAESKESVLEMINGASVLAQSFEADFLLFQEVDWNSTRSYHMNQKEILDEAFSQHVSNYAINYDSAFLFYPLIQPHGKSKSGLALYSSYYMESAVRRSFPISTSFSKFFDLDRCFTVTKLPVNNGKYLCIYNLHMSAYGNSDEIRSAQINTLFEDANKEYLAGNYVICGGDFNHDLKASELSGEKVESWAYPFPRQALPEGFRFVIDSFTQEERAQMWDSARNADMEYVEGETFTVTLDGFIISDNIESLYYENVRTGYSFSDHDPVFMKFSLLN